MSSEPAAPNLPLFCQPLNRATSGGFFCKFQCIFVVDNCSAPVLLLEEACSWEVMHLQKQLLRKTTCDLQAFRPMFGF